MTDRRPDSTLSIGLESDDRGVSEVVAFILIFAIILGSIGILYSTGFGAMMDYQENEQQTNAVRAMDSLTDNFNDVLQKNGVNQRYGELTLRDGLVTSSDSGTPLNITINDSNTLGTAGGDQRFTGYGDGSTVDLGQFAYESDNREVAYEGGGLVGADETGSAVLRQPQLRCDADREIAIISLVSVSAEDRSLRTTGSLGVTMTVENRSSAVYTGVENVSIEISGDTEYETAWERTLSDTWDGDGCDFDSGRVVVTIVEVDIDY